MNNHHRIDSISFGSVYPLYVAKAQRKQHTKQEVDQIIQWLTGYDDAQIQGLIIEGVSFEDFFKKSPRLNPARKLITGVVCGVRVETISEPIMQEIRYLDKLIDELAAGKPIDTILRKNP